MVQTGFRASEEMNKSIDQIAKKCSLSKNSATKMLVALGIEAFNGIAVNLTPESLHELFRSLQ